MNKIKTALQDFREANKIRKQEVVWAKKLLKRIDKQRMATDEKFTNRMIKIAEKYNVPLPWSKSNDDDIGF